MWPSPSIQIRFVPGWLGPLAGAKLKAIQRELGESDDRQDDLEELKRKIKKAGMTEEAEKVAMKELKRMARMNPSAAEYTVNADRHGFKDL